MKFLEKIKSRKFIAMLIMVTAFFVYPEHFTGTHLIWGMAIFVGGNVGEHVTETIKAIRGSKTNIEQIHSPQ